MKGGRGRQCELDNQSKAQTDSDKMRERVDKKARYNRQYLYSKKYFMQNGGGGMEGWRERERDN